MNNIEFQIILDNNRVHSNYITDNIYGNDDIYQQYVSVEYLQHKDKFLSDTVLLKTNDILSSSTLPLLNDGIHSYYRFIVPTLEYLFIESDNSDADGNMLYSSICLTDQIYYYNGKFYYYTGQDIEFKENMTVRQALSQYLETIEHNSIELHVENLYDYINKCRLSFFCKKILFSICNLTKCFVSLQKDLIKGCTNNCNEKNTANRDFLMSTIFVLDYLKDTNNFIEAQRILDNITECSNFCSTGNKFNCCG